MRTTMNRSAILYGYLHSQGDLCNPLLVTVRGDESTPVVTVVRRRNSGDMVFKKKRGLAQVNLSAYMHLMLLLCLLLLLLCASCN